MVGLVVHNGVVESKSISAVEKEIQALWKGFQVRPKLSELSAIQKKADTIANELKNCQNDPKVNELKDLILATKLQIKEYRKLEKTEKKLEDIAKSYLGWREAPYRKLVKSLYHLNNVRGDGNCLLYSLVRSKNPNLSRAEEDQEARALRQALVWEMWLHGYQYRSFVPGNYNDYVQEISKNYTWLGNVELKALAKILRRPIYVYSAEGSRVDYKTGLLLPPDDQIFGRHYKGAPLTIYFESAHYQYLTPKKIS